MIIQSEKFIVKPLLSVIICTYNQENTISQTIESVLSQLCDFSYEIIIGEDCGNDETRSICINYQQKYPDFIKLILHDKNKGLLNNYLDCLKTCQGDYIAQCAGDDYWIDTLKLQKQIDFLNNNEEYGLVHTSYKILSESTNSFLVNDTIENENDTTFDRLIEVNRIAALTCCFRKSVFEIYLQEINPLEKGWLMEDYPFWLWMSNRFKIKFIPDKTAVYRMLNNSASNSKDPIKNYLFEMSVNEIREFFAIKSNKLDLIRESLREFYFDTFQYFYEHSYLGDKAKILKIKLNLYTKLSYLDKIRLWGLNNKYTYFCSKKYIDFHKKLRKMLRPILNLKMK